MIGIKTNQIKNRISAVVFLACLYPALINAAVITVDASDRSLQTNGLCSINEAMKNANNDAATYPDCIAGSGADTIILATNVILDGYFESSPTWGRTGTPSVSTVIIVDGMSHTIERSNITCDFNGTSQNEYRLFRVRPTGNLTIQNLTIKNGCPDGNNELAQSGGAVFSEGTLELYNNLFIDNNGQNGGAIRNDGGTITDIANNTFSNNIAITEGGVIFNNDTGVIHSITNNTFVDNMATNGGAVHNYGGISNLNNNLFSENSAANADCETDAAATTSGANNLSNQDNNNCAGAGITSGVNPANIGILDDYGCINPTSDGDCVYTYELLSGNIAINAGDSNSTLFDQRGFVANGIRDIGAFESDGIIDLIFSNGFD